MRIVKNETAKDVPGIGTVNVEPMTRAGIYFREHYGRTHEQSFNFEANGREYWGQVMRARRDGRMVYDVILRTRKEMFSPVRTLAETDKVEWRKALVNAFKDDLEVFAAQQPSVAEFNGRMFGGN